MTDSDERPGRGWTGWAQVGVIVLVVAVGIYFARAPQVPKLDDTAAQAAGAPAVRVMRPAPSSHAITVALTGEVHARNPVRLQPLAAGRVVEVSSALRPGGTFSSGETLLVVDPEDARLALEMAQGGLDAARGRLRQHREQGALDADAFRRANPSREVPPIVAREPQIERFEGRVRAARAAVAAAQRALDRTQFSLPFDGTVIGASVTVGDLVASAVGTAFRSQDLEALVPIPVADLAYMGDPRGRAATVEVGGRRFAATVSGVSPVLTPKTRLSTLFIDFAEPDEGLPPPGAFVRVSLRGPAFDNAFLLPDSAHRSGDSAWLVDDGELRRITPRTLGRSDAGWIVAAFDVADGVVVGPVPGEHEGLSVTAVAADEDR